MKRTMTRHRARAWRTPVLLAGLTPALVASMLAGAVQATPTIPASSDQAIARTLAHKPTSGWSSVILKTAGALTSPQEARLQALGVDVTRRLPIIGSVVVRVPSRNLRQVAALPFVTHLSLNGPVEKSDDFTVGSSGANQAFATSASGSTYALTGQGVTVAVIDSGVRAASPDLQYPPPPPPVKGQPAPPPAPKGSRVLASISFVAGPVPKGLPPDDPCGHGTHVAGIIGGNGAASSTANCFDTFSGITPQANLVSVRVLDQNGQADIGTVISGLQWVIANKNTYNIRVVNLSLGHPVGESYRTDPLCQAVEAAYRAGIVVVCAAGNTGRFGTVNLAGASNEGWGTAYGSIQSPANDPYVITVGATKNMDGVRADDRIATYSSRGPSRVDLVLKPDILAPGNKVISLTANNSLLDNYDGGTNDIPQSSYMTIKSLTAVSPSYFRLSGTSMASPVVAGAAALLLQASPNLSPDTVKARLMLSADKWVAPDGTGDALTYGAGYLNIPAALVNTAVAGQPASSPTLALNSDGTLSLVMDRAAWGSTSIDGSRAAWGSGLWGTGITDLRAAWGSSVGADRAAWGSSTNADGSVSLFMDRAAWGSTTLAADRAAWGSSLASADRAAWGSSSVAGSSSPSVDLTSTAIAGE